MHFLKVGELTVIIASWLLSGFMLKLIIAVLDQFRSKILQLKYE